METLRLVGKNMLQIRDGGSPDTTTWYSRMALAALVMALIASQNLVNPPGAKRQEDTPFHKAGDVVIASTLPDIYKYLMLTNMVALSSALLTVFLIAIGWPTRNIRRLRWMAKSAMWVSLIAIAMSYVGPTMAIAPNTKIKPVKPVVRIAVMLVSIGITLAISAFHTRVKELTNPHRGSVYQ
ncbi:hypothetical protein SASPL_119288 [Salvia splendens]|uniref:PGG domain-containing protein n=1 Tax=Salvia splendens TaxID=180675 RepID=A0A8X8ZT09_SALSN|nr:hypothetical protein SASPL_119288 [Salvia splendens]